MLLFKPEHRPLILSGQKTQTRRLWPHGCRVRVGAEHQAQTGMFSKDCFAILHIERVWRENLWDISDADAVAEGYIDRPDYLEAFIRINRMTTQTGEYPSDLPVWAVAFHVAYPGTRVQRAAALFAETQGTTLEALRASGNWTGLKQQEGRA